MQGKFQMLVVFIAGASASGKTKFAELLLIKLNEIGIDCLSLKMDDYYKEIPADLDLAQYKQMTNFDNPNSLDLLLLKEHIITLRQGEFIDKPVFDFKIERRIRTEPIAPPAILLLDGTSALFFANHFMPDLQTTYKVFIEVNQTILLKRRTQRDLLERGYADEMSILKKDAEYVRPTFCTLIEPTKNFADIIINNNEDYAVDTTTQLHPFTLCAEKTVETLKDMLIDQ